MPLPTAFPVAQITELISKLEGTTVAPAQVVSDLYDVIGFALGQVKTWPTFLATAPLTDAELASHLKAVLDSHQEEHKFGALPWSTILPALLSLLQTLLPLLAPAA